MASAPQQWMKPKPAIYGGPPLFGAWVPVARPELPVGAERASLAEAMAGILESGLLTNGPAVRRLEQMAAAALGVSECVAVSSCTTGLMLVLRCLGLAGEVILPSFTFFATGHAALWNGLRPVLADCGSDSFNIDPQRVEELITQRTSAIVAVHVFGNPAPAAELEAVARDRGLKLIFDAAHAFGASAGGRAVGGAGDAEVFSLSPTKLLVAGEGGLVTTGDAELARRLRTARNYGDPGTYDCEILGLNARLTEAQAALAAAGLEGVGRRVAQRNRLATLYQSRLAGERGLRFQRVGPGSVTSRKDFAVLIDQAEFGVSRDFLRTALELENVAARSYFDPPLDRQKLYQRCRRGDLRNTDWISRRVLNLPMYSGLSEQAVEAIAERILLIRDAVRRSGHPAWWRHRLC